MIFGPGDKKDREMHQNKKTYFTPLPWKYDSTSDSDVKGGQVKLKAKVINQT